MKPTATHNGELLCPIKQPQTVEYISQSTSWNGTRLNGSTMRDRTDDSLHQEQMLYYAATSHSPSFITSRHYSGANSSLSCFSSQCLVMVGKNLVLVVVQ